MQWGEKRAVYDVWPTIMIKLWKHGYERHKFWFAR